MTLLTCSWLYTLLIRFFPSASLATPRRASKECPIFSCTIPLTLSVVDRSCSAVSRTDPKEEFSIGTMPKSLEPDLTESKTSAAAPGGSEENDPKTLHGWRKTHRQFSRRAAVKSLNWIRRSRSWPTDD